MLFNFIIYPSCEKASKNGTVKSKILRKLPLITWIFWLRMIVHDYFSSVLKWVSHLKNRFHYAKVVENARINFSISPYCTMLFSRKENFLEVTSSAVLYNSTVGSLKMFENISIECHTGHLLAFRKH